MGEAQCLALSDELLDGLLASAHAEERAALLDSHRLLSPEGVAALLATAEELVNRDPGRGRQIATIAAEVAEATGLPAARSRAHYLIAQAHAGNAEFETALALLEQTRAEFEALDERFEALRTTISIMEVLREQGRYQQALDAGAGALAALNTGVDQPATRSRLRAMCHESLGSISEEMGRYDEALAAYAAAEAGYAALGMHARLGAVSNNRGVVLLGLGRGRAALTAFEQAAERFADNTMTLLQAQALLNIGSAHLLLGAYHEALASFEQSRRLFADLDALADAPILLLDTADVYLALCLYPEAVATYTEADELLRAAGMPYDRARALWGLGIALGAQGRLDEADAALAEAMALFQAAENLPLLSGVLLERAGLLTMRGRRNAALAMSREALALIAGRDFPIQHVYAHLRVADLLLPDREAAETHLRAAAEIAETLGLPHLRYRVLQRRGRLRLLQGRHAEALPLLETAIATIEGLRGTLPFEAVRASFLHDKTAAFEDLVLVHLAASDPAAPRRAFEAAERAKSRSLVDLLAGETARSLDEPDPGVAARRATLQADLNAIYLELLGGAPECGYDVNQNALRARAAELEHELSLLRLRAAASPEQPASQHGLKPSVPVAPSVPLVAYHILGEEVIAFVQHGDALSVIRDLCDMPTLQRHIRRLGDQWERFRLDPGFVAQHHNTLLRTVQHALNELHRLLFAPLEPYLPPASAEPLALALVPHGPLHQVPFHALYDGERYLIDRFELNYAPSATVLALCAARRPREDGPALVVGISDPGLPNIAAEVAHVAALLPGSVLIRDAAATRAAVSAHAVGCRVFHLASHGLFRADNPLYSALQLGDGWLTASDVLGLDLTGALVVLSACESGRGAAIGGDEVLGLARSFLGAGAVTLVVSLWLVQDEAAAELMLDWYRRLGSGLRPAAALREAQISLRDRFPHPYYWAPFALVGRP